MLDQIGEMVTPGGWMVAASMAIVTGWQIFRRTRSDTSLAVTSNSAAERMIEALEGQVKEANIRADQFAKERNEAYAMVGELKVAIARLEMTVERLRQQIDGSTPHG